MPGQAVGGTAASAARGSAGASAASKAVAIAHSRVAMAPSAGWSEKGPVAARKPGSCPPNQRAEKEREGCAAM